MEGEELTVVEKLVGRAKTGGQGVGRGEGDGECEIGGGAAVDWGGREGMSVRMGMFMNGHCVREGMLKLEVKK